MDGDIRTSAKGIIFDIQRFSIHDGPGIRTTVFLKGCPLRCTWCHNPEGQTDRSDLSFTPSRCIDCGQCFKVCPHGVHVMAVGNEGVVPDILEEARLADARV